MTTLHDHKIEAVWGRLDGEVAEQLVHFCVSRGALGEPTARQWIRDAVCVLRDREGQIAGVNSVRAERVPLIGGRRFWTYRMVLASGTDPEVAEAMIGAAREELERHFEPGGEGPIGLFLLVADPALLRRRPEAFWPESGMLYAGYTADGRQVRLGLFEDAVV